MKKHDSLRVQNVQRVIKLKLEVRFLRHFDVDRAAKQIRRSRHFENNDDIFWREIQISGMKKVKSI